MRGLALLTHGGTPLAVHGALDDPQSPFDWPQIASTVLSMLQRTEDEETALAELTDGLSLRDLRFTLVRVGIADIDAVGVEGNGFALKLAALPWRLVLMVLSDKQDAATMRQMTADQVAAVRA